jgi:TatD DNase family protein
LETDAPYLSPVPFRGKRNEPSYLTYIAARTAFIMGMEEEELRDCTTDNARKLFDL